MADVLAQVDPCIGGSVFAGPDSRATLLEAPIVDDTLAPLIRDLLEWIAKAPRTQAEVLDDWHTSCPRLPVWEEATDLGYVARKGRMVELTAQGRTFLESSERKSA
jgi:hypothetical protein